MSEGPILLGPPCYPAIKKNDDCSIQPGVGPASPYLQ
jgi:hypothetical protein